jgi:hypothetical protein
VEKFHLKIPVPAGSNTTGNTVQKNTKHCRAKPGSASHPQPPLFSTLDVSSLKAPTGSSYVGQGFCGHTPPHSAGNLLDCVSTTERTLMSKEKNDIARVQMERDNDKNNTRTFIRSVNDIAKFPSQALAAMPKVKVSQISVTVKPNCVKTGTPPFTNPTRRTATVVSKSSKEVRNSVSSPEAMSIGGDDTTSSEKGSRSPSPPHSTTCSQLDVNQSNEDQFTEILLDNAPQSSTPTQEAHDNNTGTGSEISRTMIPSSTGIQASTERVNDNINGNIVIDHAITQ